MLYRYVVLAFLFVGSLYANNQYILSSSGLIDPRADAKIKQIGDEVKQKLNVNIYLDIKGDNGINMKLPIQKRRKLMKQYENTLIKKAKRPYVILAISVEQMYANLLYSDDLKSIIDKDDILDGYVIPLLASKDKNSLFAKVSAASLNGYAQIADALAQSKNIKLVSSIGNEGKVTGTIWKVFMYSVVLIGIVLYTIIVLRERKYKKGI